MVCDLIEDYVRQRDLPSYIATLWDRIGARLKAAGVKPGDVAKALRETRKARKRDAGRR